MKEASRSRDLMAEGCERMENRKGPTAKLGICHSRGLFLREESLIALGGWLLEAGV